MIFRISRRELHGDKGSALVLALVFLSLFGVFVAALLSFTDTSLRITGRVRAQGDVAFAADGAVETAIAHLQANPNIAKGAASCDAITTEVNAQPVTVECEADPAGGVPIPGGGSANSPEYAVLTLGTTAGDDTQTCSDDEMGDVICYSSGPVTLSVGGPIFANRSIIVDNNNTSTRLGVAGTATAHSCRNAGRIYAVDGTTCDSVQTEPDPGIADPSYNVLPSSAPPPASVPSSCPGPSSAVVQHSPGSFTGATATALESFLHTCERTHHFQPGVYYFEFPNGPDAEWLIDNANTKIVGGTLLDPIAGTCDPAQAGVLWIFGGETHVKFTAGEIALCAEPTINKQQIAIYGIPNDAESVAGITAASVPSAGGFINPDRARVRDSQVARGTVDNDGGTSAPQTTAIGLASYGHGVPAGSTITSAAVRVRHRESTTSSSSGFGVGVAATVGGGNIVQGSGNVSKCTSLCEQAIPLQSSIDTVAELDALSVTYSVTTNSNASRWTELDSIILEITYLPPGSRTVPLGMRVQSGCVTVSDPAQFSNSCHFLWTEGNLTRVDVNGTVYAPDAKISLQFPNDNIQLFRRGLILRSALFHLPASGGSYTRMSIPPSTGGGATPPRKVLLTAKSSDGSPLLRALVEFHPTTHVPTVKSWSVVR